MPRKCEIPHNAGHALLQLAVKFAVNQLYARLVTEMY